MTKIALGVLTLITLIACTKANKSEDSSELRIVRDSYGVAHVYADDVFGLYYGYGYAVAQDRLFQMEMARRSTQGTVSEVLGSEFLAFDKNARQIYSPASIKQQLAALEGADRQIFDGFAAGLNAWLAEIRLNPTELMPKQFNDFDFAPNDWNAYDIVMIFVGTMANRYGDFNTELENAQILASLTAQHGNEIAVQIFDSLNPRYSESAPTTISTQDWSSAVPDVLASDWSNRLLAHLPNDDYQTTDPISGMSNCFVLGADKVAGAAAIIVNGPQFGWFNPAYTYSIGLHGAGIDVAGNTPFAYPFILFGHNDTIAWGSTWGAGDIVDIYVEELDKENRLHYRHDGKLLKMEHRVETIKVRDEPDVNFDAYRSVHGAVVLLDEENGFAYAKKRAWDGYELETLLAWVHTSWAKNFEEWQSYVAKGAINVNMYYADVDGNIGYMFGGRYPQRKAGHDNRFPVSGDGSMDWQGRLPIAQANPHVKNPVSGYVANWNNKPAPGVMNPDEFWYSWSEADRVDFLHSAIDAQPTFTPDEAWGLIEKSSYADLYAEYFLPMIDSAISDNSTMLANSANEMLQDWNRESRDDNQDGYYDEAATAVFRLFVENVIEAVLADDLGDVFPFFAASGYPTAETPTGAGTNLQTGAKAVIASLRGGNNIDFLNDEVANDVVAQVFERTVMELKGAQGASLENWQLATATRPFSARNFLQIPQTNLDASLRMPIEHNRGTENNMTVLRKGAIEAYEIVPPGQNAFIAPDGSIGTNHDDQFEMYEAFGRKRVWFYQQDVEANMVSEVSLSY